MGEVLPLVGGGLASQTKVWLARQAAPYAPPPPNPKKEVRGMLSSYILIFIYKYIIYIMKTSKKIYLS